MIEIYVQNETKADMIRAKKYGKPDYPDAAYGLMIAYLRSIRFKYENADEEEVKAEAIVWLHEFIKNNPNWPIDLKIVQTLDDWLSALKYGSNCIEGSKKTKDDHTKHLNKWLMARPATREWTKPKEEEKKAYDVNAPLDASYTPQRCRALLWDIKQLYGTSESALMRVPNMKIYVSKLQERAGL